MLHMFGKTNIKTLYYFIATVFWNTKTVYFHKDFLVLVFKTEISKQKLNGCKVYYLGLLQFDFNYPFTVLIGNDVFL